MNRHGCRITALETRVLAVDGSAFFGDVPPPPGESTTLQYTVTTVSTDAGVDGHTMAYAPFGEGGAIARLIQDAYAGDLLGRDPVERAAIWHHHRRKTRSAYAVSEAVVGVLDVALWDIAGKLAGLSIARMLGRCRDRIPAYATATYGLRTDEQVFAEARRIRDQGLHGYKLQLTDGPAADVPRFRAAREAVGDAFPLMQDAVGAYTFVQALEVGRALGDLGYTWFEEPIPDAHAGQLRRLCDALAVPILATETTPLGDLATYLRLGAVDLARGDVLIKCGITGLRKASATCELFGQNLEIHTCVTPLLDIANLHVAATVANSRFLESYSHPVFRFGLLGDPLVPDEEGYLRVPDAPGLGVELDWDWLDDHTIERH
jgi:L-alanine-DL-glutamate epimerase-like enolase superfamily enzyme